MATNNTFHAALQWAKAGRVELEPLVTRVIRLEDVAEVLECGAGPEDLKVQVEVG
jgi:threonine dehydrogenase-like Zn-dependent dehydrogenase